MMKAGVHALTFYLAKELAAHRITVNAVAPGPIASTMATNFPEAMVALVNIMVYDNVFATLKLCKARSDAAMDQLMKMQMPAMLILGRNDRATKNICKQSKFKLRH